jgi:predicted naringenin-chalcone synthase
MPAYIQAIGTAVPSNRFAQSDLLQFMIRNHGLDEVAAHRLRVLYRAGGIQYRHSVLTDFGKTAEDTQEFFPPSNSSQSPPDTRSRMQAFDRHALPLALQAIQNTGIEPTSISHLITVSCTGLQAPGIDIALLQQFGKLTGVQRFAIQFMGCYAAIPALRLAKAICEADPKSKVLVLSVELCTLHFQNKPTVDNLLANSLFADGAAAVMLSGRNNEDSKWQIGPTFSAVLPEGISDMAWNVGPFGFEMRLSDKIPSLLETALPHLKAELQSQLAMGKNADEAYAIHPGGKAIVEALGRSLDIPSESLRPSLNVLKNYGNMSSPTLLFVLQSLLDTKANHIHSMAFGPGLSLESLSFNRHA